MQELDNLLSLIDAHSGGSQWLVFPLLGTGLFSTVYPRFPQLRFFRHTIKVAQRKYGNKQDTGDTSHLQALATALPGTVRTGNIVGVALTIYLSGSSALFWMLMTAFLGITTEMVEVTFSHKYRGQTEDGMISGGSMYYMKRRSHVCWLTGLLAVAIIFSPFGMGNLPQANSTLNAVFSTFGTQQYIIGAALPVSLGLIVIKGIKHIAQATEKLVSFMAVVYLPGVFSILAYNYQHILPSFISVFSNIFSDTAATGGFSGATVVWAFNRGMNRRLSSNEAGQSSAPVARTAVKTEEPVSEGMIALLEPFIDTIVTCSITGLVLLSSGTWLKKFENKFRQTGAVVLSDTYHESDPDGKSAVSEHVLGNKSLPFYTGSLEIQNK